MLRGFLQKILLLIFTQLNLFVFLLAQDNQLSFEHISVKQGLSQSTVFSITQDSRGFMWFGTRTGGVNKFDGNTFKVYKNNQDNPYSISGNEILCVFEDSKGRMWMGTRNDGINRFDYNTERFYGYLNKEILTKQRNLRTITNIVEDYKGRIWVSTLGGLCLYDEESDVFIRNYNSVEQETYGIAAMCLVQDSLLCFGGKSGLYLFDTNNRKIIKRFQHDKNDTGSISSNTIMSLLYDSNGILWVGTRKNGLNRLESIADGVFTHIVNDNSNKHSISNNIIRAISEDKKGTIWICTSMGLNQLTSAESAKENPRFIHHINDPLKEKSISHDILFSFYEDLWGNFWIGTWSKGVNYLNIQSKKFDSFHFNKNQSYGLRHDNVNTFTENDHGIWVGTEGGGLSLFDRKNNKFLRHITVDENPGIIKSNEVRALYSDSNNILWIGLFDGLTRYNCDDGSTESFFDEYTVNSIQPGETNELWIGTSSGLIKYNPKDKIYNTYHREDDDTISLADNNINVLYKDRNNDIWFGTKRGLHLYNRQKDNFIRFQNSATDSKTLSNDYVISINNDDEGNLWVGTYNGLNKFNPETQSFIRYNEHNGLPDNVVNGILQDDSKNLWLSTNKGLLKIRVENKDNEELLHVRHYTESDGLQSDEFIRHSCYKTREGELMFGGIKGFNIFNPNDIKDNPNVPKVVITGLKLFNKQVHVNDESRILTTNISQTEEINLTHRQSVISISFAALSYASPEKNQFAYMMEGFDKDWNYIGNKNEAFYTNLDAGDYIFKVKAANNDGHWSDEVVTLIIRIHPPWWETWWFRILVIVLVMLVIISIYYFRLQTINRQKWALEKMVASRTNLLESANCQLVEKQEEIISQNEELEAHRNQLESLVNDRTSKLEIALKKAKESDELKSAFIANMSHEIRTPMNAVIGFSDLLIDEDLTNDERAGYVNVIQSNSKVLLRLIDEIIDLSLIESKQLKLKKQNLNLNIIIDHLYSYYSLSNTRANVSIRKNNTLHNRHLVINTDELRIKQVITNLMDNASKFTMEGHIELGVNCDDDNLNIYVEDTGIGIPSKSVDKIFMQFTKLEDENSEWKDGLGLGLAISQKIADALGGKIELKTNWGEGSTFTFALPLKKILTNEGVEVEEIEHPILRSWEGKTILIAEDVEANYLYLKKALRKTNINTLWAKNGKEAVEQVVLNSNIDLILMDIKMPALNGYEAAQEIKAHKPSQIIIAQTAYARPEERSEFHDENFDDYLAKPIKKEDLLLMLDTYLK